MRPLSPADSVLTMIIFDGVVKILPERSICSGDDGGDWGDDFCLFITGTTSAEIFGLVPCFDDKVARVQGTESGLFV